MTAIPSARTATAPECVATPVTPVTTPAAGTVVKVPVLLQEVSIQIPIHAQITFPTGQRVLEIKDIKKRVKVTQGRLIQPGGTTTSGKLFISGFIRKNIQYAANPVVDGDSEVLSGLNSLTVDVPYDCVADITSFLTPPVGPFFNSRNEFDFFISRPLPSGFPEKENLLSTDLSEFHQQSTEFFNELPFVELVRADITEFDEATNRTLIGGNAPFEEGTFTMLSEKMVLNLTLKLLQNQQVLLA